MRSTKTSEEPIDSNSYGSILRSSSIIGGAQVFGYLVGLLRVKIVAVLLGPIGIGLIGLYQSTIALAGTLTSMGIRSSGAREIAKSRGEGSSERVAQTVLVLRNISWMVGLSGWCLVAVFSDQISEWVFGNGDHAAPIALLGAALLLGAVSGGQLAFLQGVRRIGDLARVNVISTLLSTTVSISLYAWMGISAIPSALIATAFISLCVSWWFARQVELEDVKIDFRGAIAISRKLVSLGLVLTWGALLMLSIDLMVRSIVTSEFGVASAGFYQAAWALSGMFAGFVLTAMGADYLPRLTAAIDDRSAAVRLVNEQIEIGILLALPGLLATIALAPVAIRVLYTVEFAPAALLLPWFLVGVYGRVVSWPLGYIQIAKGANRWYLATQTIFSAVHLILLFVCIPRYGLVGVSYAFAAIYAVHIPAMLWVSNRLIGFHLTKSAAQILLMSILAIAISVAFSIALDGWAAKTGGAIFALLTGLACFRGLAIRLGPEHRLVQASLRLPGVARLINV